jgi:hypothetical protein
MPLPHAIINLFQELKDVFPAEIPLGLPPLRGIEKCTFWSDRVAFFGYVVTPQGIEVDEAKIEAIKSWLIPTALTQL